MIIALLLFWFLLSGLITVFFISAAIISIIVVIFLDKNLFTYSPLVTSINWRCLNFFPSLLKEIVLSTINVIKIIWLKPNSIDPFYSSIDIHLQKEYTKVIYANSITLTPGTMSMDIQDNKILVHALSLNYMQELQQNELEKQVLKLEPQS